MLVVMKHGATPDQVDGVVSAIESMGYRARPMPGAQRTTVGLVGNDGPTHHGIFDIAFMKSIPNLIVTAGAGDIYKLIPIIKSILL